MERKLQLSKNAYLWEVGDNAHNIAILEQGRLGVMSDEKVVGIITPKMVLGEAAISVLEGEHPKRTATVVALEDETHVTEYPAELVKKTFDSGNQAVTELLLSTLVGQTCRNGLLLMSSHKKSPAISLPLKSLVQGVANAREHMKKLEDWEEFMQLFKYMSDVRDFSEVLRKNHFVMTSDKTDMIEKASATIREMFQEEKHADLVPLLEDFVKSEHHKDDWLEVEG